MTTKEAMAEELTAEEYAKIGELLITFLHLKKKGDRVSTTWGTKTAEGLARSIQRLYAEKKLSDCKASV